MSPFDTARMTSYSTMHLYGTIFQL